MPDARKLVRVFLASPGDLADERRRAREVIEDANSLVGDTYNCRIELVGWEDTVTVFGRPQEIINRDLERCELFVGVMWKRWGTAPDTEGRFTSGFEEEFENSLARRDATGSPEMSLFFKSVSPDLLNDPGEELRKVLNFKQRLIEQKIILFSEFEDANEFEKKLRRCIFNYLKQFHHNEVEAGRQIQPAAPPVQQESDETGAGVSSEEANFFGELASRFDLTQPDSISATDVARLRLFSTQIGQSGNDEISLGVHDANIIFRSRRELALGEIERTALIRTGLSHLPNENAPLWHWLAPRISKLWRFSVHGPATERVGALRAMRISAEPIPEGPSVRKPMLLNIWFSENSEATVRVAALEFLAENGDGSDLDAIRKEFDRNDSHTALAASNAFIRISLRSSKEDALLSIYDLQPGQVSPFILHEIFEDEALLSTNVLRQALTLKQGDVRTRALRTLFPRGALSIAEAEELLEESDRSVRSLAIDYLAERGKSFSDEAVKSLLTLPQAGLLSSNREEHWLAYRRAKLRRLEAGSLQALLPEESIFEIDVLLATVENDFAANRSRLVDLISDRFEAYFNNKLEELEQRYGKTTDFVVKTKGLGAFVRKDMTRKALDVLCSKGSSKDLPSVRHALLHDDMGYSRKDTEFLRKHGEWKDIKLLIKSISRLSSPLLIGSVNAAETAIAARSIVALGKHRLRELLDLEMPAQLLHQVVLASPDEGFGKLSDTLLLKLLNNESDRVRKACALKIAKSATKKRIDKLLRMYVDHDDYRYYNTIHWLDFANSLPAARVRKAVRQIINQVSGLGS